MDVSSFAATLSQTYSDKILQLHNNTRPTRCCTTLRKCVMRQREPGFSVRLPASSTQCKCHHQGFGQSPWARLAPFSRNYVHAPKHATCHHHLLCNFADASARPSQNRFVDCVLGETLRAHVCRMRSARYSEKQSPESLQQQGSARTRTQCQSLPLYDAQRR